VETYGHPSKVGYKDLVDNWKAAKWDPEHLMSLYKKAGAKYFVSMGVHHDNFDLWDSKYTRWNAVKMGPKKDIVGLWRRRRASRACASESASIFGSVTSGLREPRRRQDRTAGRRPYDGVDPQFADLISRCRLRPAFIDKLDWNDDDIPESWKRHYLDRMTDLIDKYQPDLLYTDGHLPFEDTG
jgi:alpha-L-fucosidase